MTLLTREWKRYFHFIFVIWSFASLNQCEKIKNFRVSSDITTGWTFCRNQALYACEFLYSVDKETFWKFFKDINDEHFIKSVGKNSDHDQSFIIEKILTKYFSKRSKIMQMLKLNLEMEVFAPRIEAMSQIQSSIDKDCEVFIEYERGLYTCSIDFLEENKFEFTGIGNSPNSFDYIHYSSASEERERVSAKTFRIYSIPGTKQFNVIFDVLSERGYNIAVQLLVKPTKCPFYQEEVFPTGYGLEFELKSSQYVVEEEQEELPDDSEGDNSKFLKSMNVPINSFNNIKAVPNYQARALKSLKDASSFEDILDISTNLLLISDKLKNVKPKKSEIAGANQIESTFRINDLELKSSGIDSFKIMDFMNLFFEMTVEGDSLKIPDGTIRKLLHSRLTGSNQQSTNNPCFNLQSDAITFLNNLEKDIRYSKWEKSLGRKIENGQFYGKNILTVVFPLNFSDENSASLLENLIQIISHGYPLRLAIVPIVSNDHDLFVKSFFAVRQKYGLRATVKYLNAFIQVSHQQGDGELNDESQMEIIEIVTNELNIKIDINDGNLLAEEAYDISRRFNLKDFNGVFANGRVFDLVPNLLQDLLMFYSEELSFIFERGLEKKSIDLYEAILDAKEAKQERFVIDSRFSDDQLLPIESIVSLMSIKHYIEPIVRIDGLKLTSWFAADFHQKECFSFLIHLLKSTVSDMSRLRVFVSNPMTSMSNRIVLAASGILKEPLSETERRVVIEFLEKFEEQYFSNSTGQQGELFTTMDQDDPIIKRLLGIAANLNLINDIVRENEIFFSIYGPLIEFREFFLYSVNGNSLKIPFDGAVKAMNYLQEFVNEELEVRAERFYKVASEENLSGLDSIETTVLIYSFVERKLLKSIDNRLAGVVSTSIPTKFPGSSTPIEIGDEISSLFHVEAMFNPFNREGQKFSSIMSYLSNMGLFSFKLYLIGDGGASDPKESRIYRFVTPESKGTAIPIIPVSDPDTLLALTLDLPSAWMIVSTYSNADLDNIRPMKVPHLQASFALTRLTLEGQVTFSGDDREVATGKIVQLFSVQSGLLVDETSVMANFGYFQLKGTPGVYRLRVKDDEWEYPIEGSQREIMISSFSGQFVRLSISRQDRVKLPDSHESGPGADINIFSLASGLFYERLLRIMIRSVMKQQSKKKTAATVKFWLLETTLSAKGVLALDVLSRELGFEYELMAYNWPSWLNPQAKKHRTIWAYKILFLDVLFPRNLKRIIFIDADQVVRSDLMELVDLDLEGHVYAMTPFCNDKTDMAPFRFWEHNYWKHHLEGRPYHISALFVVDLLVLREKYVADILRSQYNALSKDPNSLSNLDQDLPNNLQQHIPIFPLPQEWLWCDTWCSQATKSTAKTIDLCNNPKTFESKLDQAKRIIPEWKEYDEEIKQILTKSTREYQKNLKSTNDFVEHFDL